MLRSDAGKSARRRSQLTSIRLQRQSTKALDTLIPAMAPNPPVPAGADPERWGRFREEFRDSPRPSALRDPSRPSPAFGECGGPPPSQRRPQDRIRASQYCALHWRNSGSDPRETVDDFREDERHDVAPRYSLVSMKVPPRFIVFAFLLAISAGTSWAQVSLEEAVDEPALVWVTGGEKLWQGVVVGDAKSGGDVARCGPMSEDPYFWSADPPSHRLPQQRYWADGYWADCWGRQRANLFSKPCKLLRAAVRSFDCPRLKGRILHPGSGQRYPHPPQ
jgi:hypothetical protein